MDDVKVNANLGINRKNYVRTRSEIMYDPGYIFSCFLCIDQCFSRPPIHKQEKELPAAAGNKEKRYLVLVHK